jgi:calpain-5
MDFWKGQSYTYLRRKAQGISGLFEDPEFPPTEKSIWLDGIRHHAVEWKRPREICGKPQLVLGDLEASKFQLGMLGNCWFAATCSSLCQDRKAWNKVVPNWRDQNWDDDNAPQKYSGIFKFRLWVQGKFYEVVVDDRLPTIGNHLLFCHSKSTNEFWCALLEKACAKIAGCYEALASGHSADGLVHFTGGIPNIVDLSDGYKQDGNLKKKLFKEMFDAFADGAFMTCNMYASADEVGTALECGLVKGHPYAISEVRLLTLTGSIRNYVRQDEVQLVRLVYPWGDKEWNGAWSDGSRELASIPVDEIDFVSKNLSVSDGEFWMSFDDWLKWFDDVGMVHVINNRLHSLGKVWYEHKFQGKWNAETKTFSAGGCVNYPDTFLKNPQVKLPVLVSPFLDMMHLW